MANLGNYLRRHPFPVVAWFERVVAVSFAFPEDTLRSLVPRGLEIDAYKGLGFVTVAMVWTKKLRPAGFPAFLGKDFFLAGYRIFTRLSDGSRRLRGLKIVRSETDSRRMVWLGNLMTRYRYRRVNLRIQEDDGHFRVETSLPDGTSTLDLTFAPADDAAPLPEGSPFADWQTARQFAGPMPFTFSAEDEDTFVVVEGSRQNWVPRGERERSAWFSEARRCLRRGGRIVLVEHLRDVANFLAFGPGFLHFQSRETWRRSWESAGFRPIDEFRVTPWVNVFVLAAP